MENLHVEAVLFYMLAVKALPVLSMDLHHSNNKSYESLRLIRSATAIGSLDQTRVPSVTNCYNSTCVLNEEFCNESKKGCERCLYEDGKCTANWDCFNVCSEKKAQEICRGLEGSVETTGTPWWSYLILVIFIISVVLNIYFVIEKLLKRKRHEMEKRQKSDNEVSETSVMLSTRVDESIQMNPQPQEMTPPKEPSAPPKTEPPRDLETEFPRGPIAQPTPDTLSEGVPPRNSENKF